MSGLEAILGDLRPAWAGLALTLTAFAIAEALQRRAGGAVLLNPGLIAILLIAAALLATGIDHGTYMAGAGMLAFLLGPAVVLLAVHVVRRRAPIAASGGLIALAVVIGAVVAVLTAETIAALLGASRATLVALAPKSVTTGIAVTVADRLGGIPALTSILVIGTGLTGAVLGPAALRLAQVRDERATGLALGIAAHGFGTARAFQIGEVAGAFAGLGMAINGVLTATTLSVAAVLVG